MRTPQTAWVFDVDGVITNPQKKRITEPQILDEIVEKLKKKDPIALNTGRSIEWIKNKVLNLLIEKVKEKSLLQNLLVVGEKGGTWLELDSSGNLLEDKDKAISVPGSLKKEIRNLITTKYSDSMFFDESKQTMISTEMKDGYSLDDYRKKQKNLSAEFNTLLSNKNLRSKFKIEPTTIAVDIENIFVGKHFAIKRILEWLKKKGIKPLRYITFGDSFDSDIPMAKEIYSQKLPVEFVYVGQEKIDSSKCPFVMHQAKAKFEKGTLEFLQNL